MKNKIVGLIGATILTMGMHAHAAPLSAEAREFCEATYDLSYNTMIMRTLDFTKEAMYSSIDQYMADPVAVKGAKKIVDSAFEVPLNGTEKSEQVAHAFGKMEEAKCVQSKSGISI